MASLETQNTLHIICKTVSFRFLFPLLVWTCVVVSLHGARVNMYHFVFDLVRIKECLLFLFFLALSYHRLNKVVLYPGYNTEGNANNRIDIFI